MKESTDEQDFVIAAGSVRFRRDDDNNIHLQTDGEERAVGGLVSAFPLTDPTSMVSVRDVDGEEIGIIDDVARLDPDSRDIVNNELERSYFMPLITDIFDIRETMNVVEWDVETNKGPREFQVRSVRKHIRRIGQRQCIIKDVDGNRYEINDWMTLPVSAQKLIEPYV